MQYGHAINLLDPAATLDVDLERARLLAHHLGNRFWFGFPNLDDKDPAAPLRQVPASSETSAAEECTRRTLWRCSAQVPDRRPSAGLRQLGYGLTEDRPGCAADQG